MTYDVEDKTPWNPSKTATARVLNPLPAPETCPYCSGPAKILTHKEIYGKDFNDWPWMYGCKRCDAYVGMHPFTNIPLGTIANAELRKARNVCKKSFERIWQEGRKTRSEAYAWLAEQMKMTREACHFGWFNAEQCYEAKTACDTFLSSKP